MAEYWAKYTVDLDPCLYLTTNEHEQDLTRYLNGGHFASVFVESLTTEKLENFVQRNHGLRASSICRAAWALILGAFTGQTDICFYALQLSVSEGAGLGLARANVEPETTIYALLHQLRNDEEKSANFLFDIDSARLLASTNEFGKLCNTVLIDYNHYSARKCLQELDVSNLLCEIALG